MVAATPSPCFGAADVVGCGVLQAVEGAGGRNGGSQGSQVGAGLVEMKAAIEWDVNSGIEW